MIRSLYDLVEELDVAKFNWHQLSYRQVQNPALGLQGQIAEATAAIQRLEKEIERTSEILKARPPLQAKRDEDKVGFLARIFRFFR